MYERLNGVRSTRFHRWGSIALGLLAFSGGAGGQNAELIAGPESAVTVTIALEPGSRGAWMASFEEHIVPSIREAIEREELTGFEYFETVVSDAGYDVLLVLKGPSYSFFDERRPFPHYAALSRRLGEARAQAVLADMTRLERDVSVRLSRAYGLKP